MAPPVEPPLTRLELPWKRLLVESCLVGRWLTLCVYRAQQALWGFEFEHCLLPAPLLRRKFRDWVGSNEYGGRIWLLVELYLNKLGIKGNLGRIFSSIRMADPWKVSLQLQGADTLHRLNWADLAYWKTTLPADASVLGLVHVGQVDVQLHGCGRKRLCHWGRLLHCMPPRPSTQLHLGMVYWCLGLLERAVCTTFLLCML